MSTLFNLRAPRDSAPAVHRVNELSPEMAQLIIDVERRKKACAGVHRRMQVSGPKATASPNARDLPINAQVVHAKSADR